MIKSQGLADLLTAYNVAKAGVSEIYMTWIESGFVHDYPKPFDPGYMGALYEYGFNLMMSGRAWSTRPPQVMTQAEREASLRERQ